MTFEAVWFLLRALHSIVYCKNLRIFPLRKRVVGKIVSGIISEEIKMSS